MFLIHFLYTNRCGLLPFVLLPQPIKERTRHPTIDTSPHPTRTLNDCTLKLHTHGTIRWQEPRYAAPRKTAHKHPCNNITRRTHLLIPEKDFMHTDISQVTYPLSLMVTCVWDMRKQKTVFMHQLGSKKSSQFVVFPWVPSNYLQKYPCSRNYDSHDGIGHHLGQQTHVRKNIKRINCVFNKDLKHVSFFYNPIEISWWNGGLSNFGIVGADINHRQLSQAQGLFQLHVT